MFLSFLYYGHTFIKVRIFFYFFENKNNSNIVYFVEIANSNMSNALQDNTEHQLPSYDSCMKLDNYVTGKIHL